jgi:hypothetical protein
LPAGTAETLAAMADASVFAALTRAGQTPKAAARALSAILQAWLERFNTNKQVVEKVRDYEDR